MTEGQWVPVRLPDGSMRQDWVPTEQPPSPDGSLGLWHVVTQVGGTRVWEWHPAPQDWRPPTVPIDPSGQDRSRRRIQVAIVAVVALVGAAGVAAAVVGESRPGRSDWDACYRERIEDAGIEGVAPIRQGCRKVYPGTEQDVRMAVVASEMTYFVRLYMAERGNGASMDQRVQAVEVGWTVCSAAARKGSTPDELERVGIAGGTPTALVGAVVANAFEHLCPEMAR